MSRFQPQKKRSKSYLGWLVTWDWCDYQPWNLIGPKTKTVKGFAKRQCSETGLKYCSHVHFANNEDPVSNISRLHKLQPLLDMFIGNSRTFCIDESLIPFRGRIIFRQYIPEKPHKLYCNGGYTWNMKIYSGKHADGQQSVPSNIVMDLRETLLDSGWCAVTDNYYTSLDLANKLMKRKTHLVGTLTGKKLKRWRCCRRKFRWNYSSQMEG